MKIAVTGASGFIGSALCSKLVEQGNEVLLISRSVQNVAEGHGVKGANVRRWAGDLSREVPDLSGVDCLYHLAADMGGVGYFSTHQSGPYIANSRITFNVLEACAKYGVSRVFLASSACAYPIKLQSEPLSPPRLREDQLDLGTPDQLYGREKLSHIHIADHVPFDCRVGVIHTVYGDPKDRGIRNKFPTAVCLKALQSAASGKLELWGDGRQMRSYLRVEDAVEKIVRLMSFGTNPGPVNIGYQGAISVKDVAELCCEILGIAPEITYSDNFPSGVLARDCDNTKFEELFGSMALMSYEKGFEILIDDICSGML